VADSTARAEADVLLASVDDPAAFRAFYDAWSTQVLGYFQRRVHDPELALELTAETFAVAFEKRGRFRWMGKSPGAWLFGIAKRILFRHLRRRDVESRAVQRLGIQLPVLDDESTRRVEELLDGAALREAVRDALDGCRPADREILQLHVIEGRPYPEVAAALGCTVNNARVRMHRALARLEERLDLVAPASTRPPSGPAGSGAGRSEPPVPSSREAEAPPAALAVRALAAVVPA
jgi:RNA polymerase sigma-70 factor (ECF subfamily)